ncbi:protein FAM227B isoform X5 [Myotis yumanensis]|uniref:protein FAM227B isoform X5 n=1 Tax=Myotis yumanensis TaxID=159337 RepID=UPI0038D1ED9A
MASQHRAYFWEPPKNIEEFLRLHKLDYWPEEIIFGDQDKWAYILKKIKEDSSFASIYTHLWENVPRRHGAVRIMEARLQECSILLKNHASKILEWENIISEKGTPGKLEKYEAFLKNHHKKKMIMLSDEMETAKNIEGCIFEGFKTNELSQLPRHLDAERIYLFVLKAHNFDEKLFKLWRIYFLSEASIAVLHDSFWWWFLHKFKPDKENQDFLFDRISESYVTLFISIPRSKKDAFFQVYPDCLTQAIYVAFQEAFPESTDLFNDEFKEDLGNNIYLWLSGLKPQKGFWTHWKLKDLTTTTIHGTKKAPAKSVYERIIRSQERIMNTIDFNMTKIFKIPSGYTLSTSKDESRILKPSAKSHYNSPGPEFSRVLFNIGGHSPLILYYLKMHELTGIYNTLRRPKIRITEISKEPSPAPTYRDIIKEANRQFAKNRRDLRMEKHRLNEEIRIIKERQERINKELKRLQAKATKKPLEIEKDFKKFLHKLRNEAKLDRELLTSLSSSSSTEDYTVDEEER